MENKVISTEYVKKNFIEKSKIIRIIDEEISTIQEENEVYYYPENVIDIILNNIAKKILEETDDKI